jgi:hypothetical protein
VVSNVRADLLSGTVVALALIPEAIAFSIIAGVDPKVGLYAASIIAIVTRFLAGASAWFRRQRRRSRCFLQVGQESRPRIPARCHDTDRSFAVCFRRFRVWES